MSSITTSNSPAEVVIGPPRVSHANGVWRVEADVEGTTTWFESSDCELLPRPEAFASAFIGPAQAARRPVRVNAPLDPTFIKNVANIFPIWRKWWEYDVHEPLRANVAASAQPASQDLTLSCFSGGVDSFHTMLKGPEASRIQRLMFVHGFDIPLSDTIRVNAFEPMLRRVADVSGKPAIVLRTNLRLHPLYRQSNWERTHGGALAAAAHVLGDGAGRLLIPSSYAYAHEAHWGSSPETDGFWSSAATQIVHDDATFNRRQKIRQIAEEPITWDALRVCWEGRTATGNCSACEKCIRTMLVLHACGGLANYAKVFDCSASPPLAQRVTNLRWIPEALVYTYEALLKEGLRGDEARAVRRLLASNKPPLARRAVRKAKRVAQRFLGISPAPVKKAS